ncbi:MAG: ROK family protein, partial [Planctomycetota bacterium]
MSVRQAIGIDLGGTNLKAALVRQDGTVLARQVHPAGVDRGPDAVIEDMADLVETLLRAEGVAPERIDGVGVGAPGPLSVREGRIIKAANLPG